MSNINMKDTIVDVINNYGNLISNDDTKKTLAIDILNNFLERNLIDEETYKSNFRNKKTKKKKDTTGAPPRGIEKPEKEVEIKAEAEVVEETEAEVVEEPKEVKKEPKPKKRSKFGWLGE